MSASESCLAANRRTPLLVSVYRLRFLNLENLYCRLFHTAPYLAQSAGDIVVGDASGKSKLDGDDATNDKCESGQQWLISNAPLPPLRPYTRCPCGSCPECRSNAKWDRIFAKFEVKENGNRRGLFRSPLADL